MKFCLRLLLLALLIGSPVTSLGHSVWIEPVESQLVVRFAEPDGKYEKSPGHLDGLTLPVVFFAVGTNAPVIVDAPKKADHFLVLGVTPTNLVCAESTFTVRGGRKPMFYARWQPAGLVAATPLTTLDLVPTGNAGEVRICLRGQPVPNVKATLRTPDEKESELVADADGLVRFTPTQSGQYLLTVAHQREPIAGFHGGRAYKETSHNAALTWKQ